MQFSTKFYSCSKNVKKVAEPDNAGSLEDQKPVVALKTPELKSPDATNNANFLLPQHQHRSKF
jgi:hypothetical protein